MKTKIGYAIEKSTNGGDLNCNGLMVAIDLCKMHMYLQLMFFRFVVRYIKVQAIHYGQNKTSWFDGRNEYVGQTCSKICECVDEMKIFTDDITTLREMEIKYNGLWKEEKSFE